MQTLQIIANLAHYGLTYQSILILFVQQLLQADRNGTLRSIPQLYPKAEMSFGVFLLSHSANIGTL